ncbi:hypothetical protein N657DRAFT_651156 [Parathielavia appendiculata]|uniref:Uncharacterized protein n=1 Tax=Parathielavia appendiculata TaxID=2587402 RepID=A0AAN6YZM0_9PEZI|nr:hypothetical protein N657DRAFT_651156 [Parathielavia appendiculata]
MKYTKVFFSFIIVIASSASLQPNAHSGTSEVVARNPQDEIQGNPGTSEVIARNFSQDEIESEQYHSATSNQHKDVNNLEKRKRRKKNKFGSGRANNNHQNTTTPSKANPPKNINMRVLVAGVVGASVGASVIFL